jgi:branched-chain amino acid transport system substrate-binding protein
MNRRQFLTGTAASAAGLAAAGTFPTRQAAAGDDVIKVGYVGALTGFLAAWGLPGYYGCQVLTDWYNAAGGIDVGGDKYKLELIAYDDEWDPAKALAGAKKVVLEDEVSFIIGSYSSPVKAMQPFLTKQKMVSTTLVQYDTSPDYPYMIAPAEPFPYENFAPAEYFIKKHGSEVKRMAICGQNEEVGLYGIASFSAVLEAAGVEVVETKIYGTDTVDFAPIVSSMLAAKPDVLCWGTSWPDFVNLLNEQAYLQGWRGPILCTTCDNYWQIIEKTSVEFLEGYLFAYPDFDDPRLQDASVPFPDPARFYNESEERWPGSWNAVSFLYPWCLELWKLAVEAGGSYEPMDVLETMKGMDPVPHIFGPGRWRGTEMNGIDNSLVGVWPAVEMQNGKAVIVDMVDINDWLDEHRDLLKKHYEAVGVA